MKGTHHSGVFSSIRFIVVMNKKAERPLAIVGLVNVLEVAFEAGNELFKSLFIKRQTGDLWIEVYLVNALGEQSSKTPRRDTIGNIVDEALPFRKSEMDVGVCLCVIFLGLLVGAASILSLEPKQMCCPRTGDSSAALISG